MQFDKLNDISLANYFFMGFRTNGINKMTGVIFHGM